MAKNYVETDPDNQPLNREERRALREQDRLFEERRRAREEERAGKDGPQEQREAPPVRSSQFGL